MNTSDSGTQVAPDGASGRDADSGRRLASGMPSPMRSFGRWQRAVRQCQVWLAARPAHALIIAFTLLASAPVFWLGLDCDDYFQLASMSEHSQIRGVARAPWDLYAFAKDPASNVALREEGVWPWWADVDALIAFFRPLASLSRWVDQTFWPSYQPLMQLHSLFWFGLMLWVVSRLYQRLVPTPWLAALALFLFASDEARAATVAWLCNRNALISLTFGFAALLTHHAARADGDRRAFWLGPICLLFGLLGGETALQLGGYFVAYALFLDKGTRISRFASLLPYGAVVVVWAVAYKLLGYGTRGSGFYVDPVREPLAFLQLVPERLAIYMLALFEGIASDWFDLLPLFGVAPEPYLLPLAVVSAALLALALRPLYQRDPFVRFWVVGALLCALPACGVRPSDRMLTGAALGGMALLATLLGALLDRSYPSPRFWVVGFACVLGFINLVYAPLARPVLIALNDNFDGLLAHADASIPSTVEVRDQTVVLLNPPFDTFAIFTRLYREAHGGEQPKHLRWLATGVSSLYVERVDARTLKIAPDAGFLSNPSAQVMRSLAKPLPVGTRVALEGVIFEVLSVTADARPKEVLVRFDEPLESHHYRFLHWGRNAYVPFALPAVGQAVTLPAVDMGAVMGGA